MTLDRPTTAIRLLYVDPAELPSALADDSDVVVSTVDTAAAARSQLTDGDGGVDCVASEYALPDDDGIALLETVRDSHPNLPFILFTDAGSEAVASAALGKGVTDYLPKDAGGERLRDRVGRAVAAVDVETDSGLTGDRMRELTNAFPDVAFIIDETGRYLELLSGPATADLETVGQERLVGRTLHDAFEEAKADRFLDHIRTTLETDAIETLEYRVETSDGPRWFEGRTAPLGSEIGGREAVVWVARDVTERRANERQLAVRRDELETITRINGLMNSIIQSLVGSASREEIERTVCEELAKSEFYHHAWIGVPWGQGERMSPSVIEGVDREPVERIIEAANATAEIDNWFSRVAEEGESVVVTDVAEADRISEEIREMLLAEDFRSAAIVPLTYGGSNYGVLSICGACSGTFGERELSALETLGEIVAFAINAVKNRNLLFSDTAVELEFRIHQSRSVFGRVSAQLECECTLEGFVPVEEDRLLEYVTVQAPESAVGELLAEFERVREYRTVSEDEGCLLEVILTQSGVNQLIKAGTVVKSAKAVDGDVTLVAEAPSNVNVRSVVDDFQLAYPNCELRRKQEVDRPVHTAQEFHRTLNEELTEKQRTALQAAYFAGYYDYPRGSTAEDVADSLGVSSPTLHQHLRAAQRKLVGTFLD